MIKILTTGGTIGGLEYANTEDKKNQQELNMSNFLQLANPTISYKTESIFNKDSRYINDRDRELLLKYIKKSKENKILITHGTYTMTDTAKYLGKLNLNKVIVFVGSFILGTKVKTDAPFNIGFALAAVQFLDTGVYIAMNGKVFSWKNVRKNNLENRFEKENE